MANDKRVLETGKNLPIKILRWPESRPATYISIDEVQVIMITKKQKRDIIRFCHSHGVKVRLKKTLECSGYVLLDKKIAYVCYGPKKGKQQTFREVLSTAAHEVAHVICYRNGLFKRFHSIAQKQTKAQLRAAIRTGWRAELFVDRMGKRLFKSFAPHLRYDVGYVKKDKPWFDMNVLDDFRKELYNH